MNEAQRGIAAYRAAGKHEPAARKQRRRAADAGVELSVEIGEGASKGVTAPSAGGRKQVSDSAPAGAPKTASSFDTSAQKRLDAEVDKKGYRKAAKMLLLLGKDEAAKVLKDFSAEQVEAISLEIARISKIDNSEAAQLFEELGMARRHRGAVKAGPPAARAMLVGAFGEERGLAILKRVVPETREVPFRFLEDIEPEQILLLLKNESTLTVSIVLPYLKPQKASKVLEALPPDIQRETIRRIARISKINPEVIARIEGVLKERIRTQGHVVTQEIDGRAALAEILKHMDYTGSDRILADLESFDPELTENVKDRLLSVDVLLLVDDADAQAVFRDFDDREIAVLLKGKNDQIIEKILGSVSSRRQAIIREELLNLGKMRKSEVDKATKDFVEYLVELDEQRKIVIHWHDQIIE